LARGLDLVVHMERDRSGRRLVTAADDVVAAAGGVGVREVWRR
jgi:hypothetical protein